MRAPILACPGRAFLPGRASRHPPQPGRRCAGAEAAAFGANLLGLLPAAWRFVEIEKAAPTNNDAERRLHRGVLWRKLASGSASAAGCRFVERLLTAVQTRRLQGRSVPRYLQEALVAHRNGLPAPSPLRAERMGTFCLRPSPGAVAGAGAKMG